MPDPLFRAVRDGFVSLRVRARRFGEPRPRFWVDETKCASCYQCAVAFTVVTRKHHCRACGRVFCHACSRHALPPRDDPNAQPERACNVCYVSHTTGPDADASSFRSASNNVSVSSKRLARNAPGTPEALPKAFVAGSRCDTSQAGTAGTLSASKQETRNVVDTESGGESSDSGASESEYESESSSLDEPNVDDAVGGSGDEKETAATTQDTTNTTNTTNDDGEAHSSTPTRTGPTRSDTHRGFFSSEAASYATELSKKWTKSASTYGKPRFATHAAHALTLIDFDFWRVPDALADGGHTVDNASQSAHLEGGTKRTLDSIRLQVASNALSRNESSSSRSSDDVDAEFVSTWTPIIAILGALAGRCIAPGTAARWYAAAQHSHSSATNYAHDQDAESGGGLRFPQWAYRMRPDCFLVTHKVRVGEAADSELVPNAFVVQRNVCDRRMASRLGVVHAVTGAELLRRDDKTNPGKTAVNQVEGSVVEKQQNRTRVKVCLLGGALEYARTTMGTPKLSSLDTLFDQEHEHLRAATAKALVSKPNVCLVEKSAASFARDLFYEKQVSLSIHAGRDSLRALAFVFGKCNGGLSAGTTQHAVSDDTPNAVVGDDTVLCGECDGWRVQTFVETVGTGSGSGDSTKPPSFDENETTRKRNRKTTLMTFAGLPVPGAGCAVLLRGDCYSGAALAAVEKALREVVCVSHHMDRVAAWVTASVIGATRGDRALPEQISEQIRVLLRSAGDLCSDTTNNVVEITSRSFCPGKPSAHGCDPPSGRFGGGTGGAKVTGSLSLNTLAKVTPYGPDDAPLGKTLCQAVCFLKNGTECPRPRCGEHPHGHVRVWHLKGGRVTMWAKASGEVFSVQKKHDDGNDENVWRHWSRCRRCETKKRDLSRNNQTRFAESVRGAAIVSANVLEMSTARFLQLGAALESRAAECGHRLFKDRAHYFLSPNRGSVCFVFDPATAMAIVVPRTRFAFEAAFETPTRDRDPGNGAAYDARVASVAAALSSVPYRSLVSGPTVRASLSPSSSPSSSPHVTIDKVTVYFATAFQTLRQRWFEGEDTLCTVREDDRQASTANSWFTDSLSRCVPWDARGGKSQAFFAKSACGNFVVKQVSKVELNALLTDFGPAYFKFIGELHESAGTTLLAKLLGAFGVAETADPEPLDFVVLENVFRGANDVSNQNWRTYDLKGSSRGRYVVETRPHAPSTDTTALPPVLLDGNLIERIAGDALAVRSLDLQALETSLRRDTQFLSGLNVMDYSLLLGVRSASGDSTTDGTANSNGRAVGGNGSTAGSDDLTADGNSGGTVSLGIIDYLRTYTWDKALESGVKNFTTGNPSSGLNLRGKAGFQEFDDGNAPTVLSPNRYAKRFRKNIARRYFFGVPS